MTTAPITRALEPVPIAAPALTAWNTNRGEPLTCPADAAVLTCAVDDRYGALWECPTCHRQQPVRRTDAICAAGETVAEPIQITDLHDAMPLPPALIAAQTGAGLIRHRLVDPASGRQEADVLELLYSCGGGLSGIVAGIALNEVLSLLGIQNPGGFWIMFALMMIGGLAGMAVGPYITGTGSIPVATSCPAHAADLRPGAWIAIRPGRADRVDHIIRRGTSNAIEITTRAGNTAHVAEDARVAVLAFRVPGAHDHRWGA